MNIIKKLFFVACVFCSISAGAVTLSGSANVNITSDTAVNAKNIAMNEARRQIIVDVLSPYTDMQQLRSAIENTESADLMNLIASTSIDGEKLSNTTYNAKINMVIDIANAREWLVNNSVQNWLPGDVVNNRFVVVANLSEPLQNIANLNQIVNTESIDMVTESISGNQITLSLPFANKTAFIIAVRENGWQSSNKENNLKIWK